MKKTAAVASSMIFGMFVLFATGAGAGGDPVSAGATVYNAKCASCHAKDGSGDTAQGKKLKLRSFGSAEVQKQSDKELSDITAKGKKKMPAYEKKLSAQQISDVVAHIRTFAKK
jgi:mono/diheme cytochrome c family protein